MPPDDWNKRKRQLQSTTCRCLFPIHFGVAVCWVSSRGLWTRILWNEKVYGSNLTSIFFVFKERTFPNRCCDQWYTLIFFIGNKRGRRKFSCKVCMGHINDLEWQSIRGNFGVTCFPNGSIFIPIESKNSWSWTNGTVKFLALRKKS